MAHGGRPQHGLIHNNWASLNDLISIEGVIWLNLQESLLFFLIFLLGVHVSGADLSGVSLELCLFVMGIMGGRG